MSRAPTEDAAADSARLMGELLGAVPAVAAFIAGAGLPSPDGGLTLAGWLEELGDDAAQDAGLDRERMLSHILTLIGCEDDRRARPAERVVSLTILGGRDKSGRAEVAEIHAVAGDVLCVVGPTGSGKSRLLADIECLAQGDTPSGRRLLIDGAPPDEGRRMAFDRKLVAQLSQNMNFVVDLTVAEFAAMHAECRRPGASAAEIEAAAAEVAACANDLTGEKFTLDTPVTLLSGGQSRALMIADAALLGASPVVLIDEIENAGVDRRRALDLLAAGDKIVFISTHDPLLALSGGRRIVIRNGGIADVVIPDAAERAALRELETLDARLADVRARLRRGERIKPLHNPDGTSR